MFELRKIGIVRRASAQLLDVILLLVLTTGAVFILSLICNYSREEDLSIQYYNEWEDFRKEYAADIAAHYGFTYEETETGYVITKDGKDSSLEDLILPLYNSKGEDPATKQAYDAYKALPSATKVNKQYKHVYSLLFIMVSAGTLFSFLVLEFIIPLILKNGQTVGKKVFGICVVRPDCVKITNLALFARTVLGKYAIETMFPVLLAFMFFFGRMGILALVLFAALELLNITLFFVSKNRTPIHDLFAGTAVADMRLQMIYNSEEELAEKKALRQKETVIGSKS